MATLPWLLMSFRIIDFFLKHPKNPFHQPCPPQGSSFLHERLVPLFDEAN